LAFESVQKKRLNIAHHTHLAGQVLYAVKKGIPSIVLIRDPLDACSSLLLREPSLSAESCLKFYLDFHVPLKPYLNEMVVASFDSIISNYAPIIERVNEMHATDFGVYRNDSEADAHLFKKMSELPSKENNLTVSLPTKEKECKKKEVLSQFETEKCIMLLEACNGIYTEFRKHC
jgi:hypothetical protein